MLLVTKNLAIFSSLVGGGGYVWPECPGSTLLLHDCQGTTELHQVPSAQHDEDAQLPEDTEGLHQCSRTLTEANT